MNIGQVTYRVGIPESFRDAASTLYDEAFGKKLSVAIPMDTKRRQLLNRCMALDFAFGAFLDGRLVGVAGFHTRKGSLTGGKIGLREFIALLGFYGAIKAAIVLALYERKPTTKELVIDGICVHSSVRGKGIGSHLLREVRNYAERHAFEVVRLDVIDKNPLAKKLYLRMGFEIVKIERFPFLQKYLGFGGVTTLEYRI
jgi:ribosomal protein S18 acetylase RimI-like enzyme